MKWFMLFVLTVCIFCFVIFLSCLLIQSILRKNQDFSICVLFTFEFSASFVMFLLLLFQCLPFLSSFKAVMFLCVFLLQGAKIAKM